RLGPVVVATQARVALGDHVGELSQARTAVVLIGERPGLSAADSLGLYLTWMPRRGRVDAERNCISNVRAGGLSPEAAAAQAATLVDAMIRHRAAGVALASRMLDN
ncbi:MAG TPA: ethanolamine ammonia-lyase light chain EutC, partial [Azospirillum sp.]